MFFILAHKNAHLRSPQSTEGISAVTELPPQRFHLPPFGKAKCLAVYFREVHKEPLQLPHHIILRRDDIHKILNNTDVEIDTQRVGRQGNPRISNAVWHCCANRILLVPYTCMMATCIASQGNNGKPRFKWLNL